MAKLDQLVGSLGPRDAERFKREAASLTSTFKPELEFERLDPVQIDMGKGVVVDGLALVNPGLVTLAASLPGGEMMKVGFTYPQLSVHRRRKYVQLPAGTRMTGPEALMALVSARC